MQLRVCLLFFLPTLISSLPGEKFRINPDDVERVVQLSNMTRRDPKAKDVNFAWKMTVRPTTATTMDPARTSTLDPELNKKNNEIYDKLFAQLAYTLRDKTYLNRWLKEMDKGYHIFLYEIQKQERHDEFYKKFFGKDVFDVEDRELFERAALDMYTTLATKEGFMDMLKGLYTNVAKEYLGPDDFNTITKPTASQEVKGVSLPAYHTMNICFAKSLGESSFSTKWIAAYEIGYDNLLKELEEKGPDYFINKHEEEEEHFKAGKGGLFWDGIIKYLRKIGNTGFQQLLRKVEALPKTLSSKDIMEKKLLDIDY